MAAKGFLPDSHTFKYEGIAVEASEAFGRAIKARRAMLDMTQEELADKTGMSRAHVSGVERGVHNAGTSAVFKLATALDCAPSELWITAEKLL